MAFSLDCCDREVLCWAAVANGSFDGALVRDMTLEAVEYRFGTTGPPAPIEWLSDSGSPSAADSCSFARELGLVPLSTPIESPQSNGMAEAFVHTLKRDCVSVSAIPNAKSVLEQLLRWIGHYNEHHPHSALKMRSSRMFRHERALAE
jgi:putative transposase